MIHKCKVQCHTVNPSEMDLLGINESGSKWLPFAIDLGTITAIKMSTDDKGEESYNCASIFTSNGDTFILDTPYHEMIDVWGKYINSMWGDVESPSDEDDLIL